MISGYGEPGYAPANERLGARVGSFVELTKQTRARQNLQGTNNLQ